MCLIAELSPQPQPHLIHKTGSPICLGLGQLGCLASEPHNLPVFPSPTLELQAHAFYMGPENQTPVAMFVKQTLYCLSHLHSFRNL